MSDEYAKLIAYYREHKGERDNMVREVSVQCFPAARYIDALETRVRELESQLKLYEDHAQKILDAIRSQLAAEFPDIAFALPSDGPLIVDSTHVDLQREKQFTDRAQELLNRPLNEKLNVVVSKRGKL